MICRPLFALVVSHLFVALAARVAFAGPFTENGTQPPITQPMQTPNSCRGCHGAYDAANVIEPWDTWAGTMMANATRDPIFWAALDVANNDLPGVGDFCLRCHTPRGWLAGRSEPPGGSTDGCGLSGKIDEASNDFEGVDCHFCHRMTTNASPPPGQAPVYYENGQYWIDDGDCGGIGEPCRHGPYNYPADGTAPSHAWAFSSYVESSRVCGNCHNVTSPAESLIIEGVNMGIPFPIERTYKEWEQSAFADSLSTNYKTCQNCHMPDATQNPVYACVFQTNNRTGDLPIHQFAGGNAWIPDVLRQAYPALNRSVPFTTAKNAALNMLQNQSAVVEVTAPTSVNEGDTLEVDVKVTNLAGHKLPTGYVEGRRMWIHAEARDGAGGVLWRTGAYDSLTGVLTEDSQVKIYRAEAGIWNRHGTNECDSDDALGDPAFHFVLDNCFAIDNRIPPLGFTGQNDLETKPKNYAYPETSPGSGVLVNYDVTNYVIPIPAGTQTPVTVTATLRYQTASKDYVEFLRDQALENNFPDDCIPRVAGAPTQSRGEILYDMWTTYGRCAPVDVDSDGASAAVNAVVAVSGGGAPRVAVVQSLSGPAEPAQRVAFHVPATGPVRLSVYDVAGRLVEQLVDASLDAGPHVAQWNAGSHASGIYVYRLETAGGGVVTKKTLVLR